MSEWITDRLPTAADADEYGDVQIKTRPYCEPDAQIKTSLDSEPTTGDSVWAHYSVITLGQPWWSPHAEGVAPAPARVVTALAIDSDDVIIAACDDGTLWAMSLGKEWCQLSSIPQSEAPNA